MAVTIITEPAELMLSRNPIPYLFESDLVGSDIRFSIIIEAESEFGLGDFTQIGEAFNKVADSNKRQVFNLSCVLDSLLQAIDPDPALATLAVGNTHCKRYRIQYSDFDESNPTSYTTHTIKFVLMGGFTFKNYLNRVANTLPTGNQLMSIRPATNRAFYIGQYEWMWLLPNTTGTAIDLQITVNYTDGTSDPSITVNYGTTTEYLPIGIPLHDSIHNYSALSPTKEIQTIEFAALGESIFTQNSFDCYNFIREFLYCNSIGGFDTLITYGQGTTETSIDKDSAETFVPYDYTSNTRQFKTFNSIQTKSEAVASGYRDKADRDAAKDALLSNHIYIRIANSYCPIYIVSTNIQDEPDGDYRYKLNFQYTFSNTEKAIAPQ